MKLIAGLSVFLCLSGITTALADDNKPAWHQNIARFFGSWRSAEVEGLGGDASILFEFGADGSLLTELTRDGDTETMRGIFTVGRKHLQFWTQGPPEGYQAEDPSRHSQSVMMEYSFEQGRLVLRMVGEDGPGVIKLEKEPEKDATSPESPTKPAE